MQAIQLTENKAPLKFNKVDTPEPKAGQVRIQLKAAAFNRRDFWIQQGMYPGIYYPCILGSDGVGIIEALGEGESNLQVGQEVILDPSLNWGDNPNVQGRDYQILGLPHPGTFAEYLCVDATQIHPRPPHMSWTEAAALPLAALTAWRALSTRGQLQAGQKVLITGIGGGVALTALQLAKAMGAEVYVTSGHDLKIEKAKAMGATAGSNYKAEDWDKELKVQAGSFDLIIDSAGGEGFSKLVKLAKAGGKIVFYGGTRGKFTINPQIVFWKQLSLLGTTMGSNEEFAQMLSFVNQHKIIPVVDEVFPLSQAEQAIQKLKDSSQFGKVVLEIA